MSNPGIVPAAGQIWFIDEPRLGKSQHGHYILVAQVFTAKNEVVINFIATESSFHDDLKLNESADGFLTTGLNHSSHLLRAHNRVIPFSTLKKGKYKGYISASLKSQVEEWWGEKF